MATSHFLYLPLETLLKITTHLNYTNLCSLSASCLYIHNVISDNRFWTFMLKNTSLTPIDVTKTQSTHVADPQFTFFVSYNMDSVLNFVIHACMNHKPIPKETIVVIAKQARKVFLKEDNILNIDAPISVVGNIHGQLADLLEIFKIEGMPPDVNFLFLGNYVNRGYFCVRVIALLFALKIKYPEGVHMIRGNHESMELTRVYSFYEECVRIYDDSIWELFCSAFNALPLVAIIDNTYFCVHSGLSPSADTLQDIQALFRDDAVPIEGPICDLLWDNYEERSGWGIVPRGVGYEFGEDITEQFLQRNNLKGIIRSHSLVMEGYKSAHGGKLHHVYSASDYCNRCDNDGAVLRVMEDLSVYPQYHKIQRKDRNAFHNIVSKADKKKSNTTLKPKQAT